MMFYIPLNKALVAIDIKKGEMDCGDCVHCVLSNSSDICESVFCNNTKRKDKKNVIYKLIDYKMETKKVNFGEIYNSFGLQHKHRQCGTTDEGLLAYFTVMEILHNFNQFIEWLNNKERWDAGEWMKKRIEWLRKGHCEVYPGVWTYIQKKRHFFSEKKKKEFEKRAADEALQMLQTPHNLLKFIEDSINKG